MHKYALSKCINASYANIMNWDDLRVFMALAKTNTLKKAGKLLSIDQASVGRRIRSLESSVGAKLFEKRSTGFYLTTAGEKIFSSAMSMEEAAHSIERKIHGEDNKAEGTIKLAMPGALANHLIIPLLKKFHENHPAIKVHLLTGAEVLNLSKREADIAFRLVKPVQKDLIVKRISNIELKIYGHETLLKKNPMQGFASLGSVPFICLYENALSSTERIMREKLNGIIEPFIYSSAWSSVFYAILSGSGIGILPSFLSTQNKELRAIELMPSGHSTLWSVIHPDLHKSQRVRLFLDFILPELKSKLEM